MTGAMSDHKDTSLDSSDTHTQMADANNNSLKYNDSTPKPKRGRKTNAERLTQDNNNNRPLTPYLIRRSVSLDNGNNSQNNSDSTDNNPGSPPEKTSTPKRDEHTGTPTPPLDISQENLLDDSSHSYTPHNDTIINAPDLDPQRVSCSNCSKMQELATSIKEENSKMKLWIMRTINEFRKEIQDSLTEISANKSQYTETQQPSAHTQSQVIPLHPDAQRLLQSLEHLKNPIHTENRNKTTGQNLSTISDGSFNSYTSPAHTAGFSNNRDTDDRPFRTHTTNPGRTRNFMTRQQPSCTQYPSSTAPRSQTKKTYGTVNINKQVDKPSRLRIDELEGERKVRQARRNNIVVRGKLDDNWKNTMSIDTQLEKIFNIKVKTNAVKRINNKVVITLGSIDLKKVIMAQKFKMRGSDVWIDDDFTPREAATQRWIEQEAENERKEGREATTRYMKMWAQNTWWRWDDLKGNLVKNSFRTNSQ